MSRLNDLIREIHRRSLWQVLLIYVGGGLVAYQAVQALTEGLGLPQWFPAFAIVLFIVGLPLVLATAFVREVAPPAQRPGETAPQTEADTATVEAEAAAVHLESGRRLRFLTWRNAAATFVVVLAAWGVVATGWLLVGERVSAEEGRNSIAVLPLANLSGDDESDPFVNGIHDDIILHLQKIGGLSPISRTSVMEYRDATRNLRQIADELGVATVLEGGVQRSGNRVRINVQLIDAETDEHLWAETYEEDLTVENVFAIQTDIAQRIASALKAQLTPEESARIAGRPTENLEAYEYYLLGMKYWQRPGLPRLEDYQNAQRLFERAVELDPRFALAYAKLSRLHTTFYWYALDPSEQRTRQSLQAAERALQIDPDLPEAHLALGQYYYQVHRDYDRALEEFAVAERGLPGEVTLLFWRGIIWRRQGKWDEALASLERTAALDPRSFNTLFELARTYQQLRRYEEAEALFDRVLTLRPDFLEAAMFRALGSHWGKGDTGPLRSLVEDVPTGIDPSGLVTGLRWLVEFRDRNYLAALEALAASEFDHLDMQGLYAPKTLMAAACYANMGEAGRAHTTADSARRAIEARLLHQPDDPRLLVALSQAHAILGHRDEAVRSAQRAVELLPISRDAMQGPDYVLSLAETYAVFGEVEAAIEQYELYLSVPAPQSLTSILRGAAIDPIRDDPRFRALVEKYQ